MANQTEKSLNLPIHLKGVDTGALNDELRKAARKLLNKQAEAFAKDYNDIGSIPNLQVNIQLNDTTPVQKNYIAVPRPLYPELKAYIEDVLNQKFICKSASLYGSPVVCIRKDQSLWLCVDYHKLNKKSQADHQPIPRIQETLGFLNLTKGKPESQPLTAFITPWGLYEWIHILFGLCIAPTSFQLFMETCLGDLQDEIHTLPGWHYDIQLLLQCLKNTESNWNPKSVNSLSKRGLVPGKGHIRRI